MNAKLLDDSMHKINSWDDGIGYAMATTLLRLPGYVPMLAFNHIVDVPLIVPHAKLSKEEVCKQYYGHSYAHCTLHGPSRLCHANIANGQLMQQILQVELTVAIMLVKCNQI